MPFPGFSILPRSFCVVNLRRCLPVIVFRGVKPGRSLGPCPRGRFESVEAYPIPRVRIPKNLFGISPQMRIPRMRWVGNSSSAPASYRSGEGWLHFALDGMAGP